MYDHKVGLAVTKKFNSFY